MRPHTLTLVAAIFLSPSASAAVYRCTTADEPPHFSQFPCGNGEAVTVEPVHTVSIPELSDAEQALLDQFEVERRAARQQRAEARARAARDARARRADRREACENARARLEALERRRRKGYTLAEARALDRQEAELEAERRRNC